jgi:hypothetical protein
MRKRAKRGDAAIVYFAWQENPVPGVDAASGRANRYALSRRYERARTVFVFIRTNRFPLILPEVREPAGRQFSIAHGVLNVLVAQIKLDRARILASVRQVIAGGVPQHVRMNRKLDARCFRGFGDHVRTVRHVTGPPRTEVKR